tara:strand:+ start:1306 stop:2208 length:903 start_codon:yes stop_codon:yes gene_type:complete
MNKFSFLYLISCYAVASIFTLTNNISLEYQIISSLILIVVFGIPHGAIDNVILQSEIKISNHKFYSLYILSILLYLLCWVISPIYSFCFFLLISAYHFGESQFANYKILSKTKKPLYMLWGTALMSTLFFYNESELCDLMLSFEDTKKLTYVFDNHAIHYAFYISNCTTLLYLIYLLLKNRIESSVLSNELFQLFLLHITFYLFPVIISFTLYFVFLHSIKVLKQEYGYLNNYVQKTSFLKFAKMLTPHTVLSLIFILCFIYMSENEIINISVLLFSIICISVITLPHSIVMTRFYKKFK